MHRSVQQFMLLRMCSNLILISYSCKNKPIIESTSVQFLQSEEEIHYKSRIDLNAILLLVFFWDSGPRFYLKWYFSYVMEFDFFITIIHLFHSLGLISIWNFFNMELLWRCLFSCHWLIKFYFYTYTYSLIKIETSFWKIIFVHKVVMWDFV